MGVRNVVLLILNVYIQIISSHSTFSQQAIEKIAQFFFEGSAFYYHSKLENTLERKLHFHGDYFDKISQEIIANNNTRSVLSYEAKIPKAKQQKKITTADVIMIFLYNEDLLNMLEILRTQRIVSSNTKIFVFVKYFEETHAIGLLELFWKRLKAINVFIADNSSNIITINPYEGTLVKRSKWDQIIFNELPKDFNGFPLNVGVTPDPPYTFYPDENNTYNEGLEIRIVQEIAKRWNFSIKYIDPPSNEAPRVTIKDGKFNGLFGMLHRQEIDLSCACTTIYQKRYSCASPLPAIIFDDYSWCAPRSLSRVKLDVLYKAVDFYVWISYFLTLISIVVILHFKKSEKIIRNLIFYIISISLDNSLQRSDRQKCSRLFLGAAIFFFLIFSTTYKTGLVTMITYPPIPPPISSFEEALKMGFVFYFAPIAIKQLYKDIDKDILERIMQPQNHAFTLNSTKAVQKVMERRAISLNLRLICEYIECKLSRESLDDKMVEFISGYSYYNPVYIYASPGHPMKYKFSGLITGLVEGGIVNHWKRELMHMTKVKTMVTVRNHYVSNYGPRPLNLDQSPFRLYGLCIICCCIIFVFEKILDCCNRNALIPNRNEEKYKESDQNQVKEGEIH